jgi:uncharacterized protein
MKIEFDPFKNEKNIKLRDLPFNNASDLDWEDSIIIPDTRKTYPEDRFIAVGYLKKSSSCLVFHTHQRWNQGYQFSQSN